MSSAEQGRWPLPGLMGWMAGRVVPADMDPHGAEARMRLGMLEGWTSTGLSIVLSSLKLLLGWMTGSIALLADGINNLADVGTSLVIALGFRWSQKPRDSKHPFGHGRIETIAALVLSITLIMVGLDVVMESVHRLTEPRLVSVAPAIIGILAVTIVVKGWMALFARRLARVTGSSVLEADFWNHQFDVLSTSVVVLALVTSRFGWATVDGWAGLVVSMFILYTGYRYARQSVSVLLGEAPRREELQKIRAAAGAAHGVRGVHDIIMHKYGDVKIASLHIEVDANRSALDAHDLAEQVERVVEEATACKTTVHVDPVDRRHPRYADVRGRLDALMAGERRIVEFHDLRVSGADGAVEVSLDVVTGLDVEESSRAALAELVKSTLAGIPGVKGVEVTLEVPYSERSEKAG